MHIKHEELTSVLCFQNIQIDYEASRLVLGTKYAYSS